MTECSPKFSMCFLLLNEAKRSLLQAANWSLFFQECRQLMATAKVDTTGNGFNYPSLAGNVCCASTVKTIWNEDIPLQQ